MVYLIFILIFNFLAIKFYKNNVLIIPTQIILALTFSYLINKNHYNLLIYNKILYDLSFSLILLTILQECNIKNINKNIIIIGLTSFIIPFLVGIFYYNQINIELDYRKSIIYGLIFSITAVPVLYLYLKNYNYQNIDFYLKIAILVDLICWIINSFIIEFNYKILIMMVCSLCFAFIAYKIKRYYILFLIILLFISQYYHFNLLLIGIIYILFLNYKKIDIHNDNKVFNIINNYISIPIIIYIGLLKIDWNDINFEFNYRTLIFIFLPIIIKLISLYIGFKMTKIKFNIFDIILLNTRGLTEIMFLNLVYSYQYINSTEYLLFLIMSIVSTLLPLISKSFLLSKY